MAGNPMNQETFDKAVSSLGSHLAKIALLEKGLVANTNAGPLQWWQCEDIEIFDDEGQLIYAGPRYFRCTRPECIATDHSLITHGMVRSGGCFCGNRRIGVALRLTKVEKERLAQWYYPLVSWEHGQIQPTCPDGKEPGWGREDYEEQYA